MAARMQLRPSRARPGDIVDVRIVIGHAMESGQRRDDVGQRIQRNIIHRLVCRYDGREVMKADIGTGIAANPMFSFALRATRSGPVSFDWIDDDGQTGSLQAMLEVVGAGAVG